VLAWYHDTLMQSLALSRTPMPFISGGQETPKPHHGQPHKSTTDLAQQYVRKINKVQGLGGRRIIS